jgi:hypothetical protein
MPTQAAHRIDFRLHLHGRGMWWRWQQFWSGAIAIKQRPTTGFDLTRHDGIVNRKPGHTIR